MSGRNKDSNPAKRFQTRGSMLSTYTLRPENDVCDGMGSVSYNDEGEKNINQYLIRYEIGKGAFGKVMLATNKHDDKNYAIKVQNMQKLKRKL
jgi:serine/threonine protein kinase